jgi:hypothetical protein
VAGGFQLQSKSALDQNPNTWADVTTPVTQSGGFNQVTITPLTGQKYYRLKITNSDFD